MEVRPLQRHRGRLQFAEARQPGEQVGGGAQHFLQVFGGVGRDLAAKTARGHVEEQLVAGLAQVYWLCRYVQQGQRRGGLQGYAGSPDKIVGRAEWQQRQAGLGTRQAHGLGNIAQRAIPASGNDMAVTGSQRLVDQALSVTGLPGDPHIQHPAAIAQAVHGAAQVFVHGLLAVQDQHCLAPLHIRASVK